MAALQAKRRLDESSKGSELTPQALLKSPFPAQLRSVLVRTAGSRPSQGTSSVIRLTGQRAMRSESISHTLMTSQYFRDMMGEANRANATFYTVDPRGLPVFDTPIGPEPPPKHRRRSCHASEVATREPPHAGGKHRRHDGPEQQRPGHRPQDALRTICRRTTCSATSRRTPDSTANTTR